MEISSDFWLYIRRKDCTKKTTPNLDVENEKKNNLPKERFVNGHNLFQTIHNACGYILNLCFVVK